MINVRNNVFETNSSSSHSFHISSREESLDTIEMDEFGVITFYPKFFGWQREEYHDAYTKALYCAIDCFNDPVKIKMLIDVIKEHTGAKDIVLNFTNEYNSCSYAGIDHQSRGLTHVLFNSRDKLRQFIFDSNSFLETDNDNG